jgi:hypothetical protein
MPKIDPNDWWTGEHGQARTPAPVSSGRRVPAWTRRMPPPSAEQSAADIDINQIDLDDDTPAML